MAAITSAVIVGGTALYSAKKQGDAAKDATRAGVQASSDANATQLQMYNQTRADNEPFRQGSLSAQNELLRMLGLPGVSTQGMDGPQMADPGRAYLAANPDVAASGMDPRQHFERYGQAEGRQWGAPTGNAGNLAPYSAQQVTDKLRGTPGYGFRMTEGQTAVETGAAARGGLYSGATAKALTRFGQGLADQTYGDHINRLAGIAGTGQTVNSQNAAAGQNYANQFGANVNNAAAARASGLQARADASSQLATGLGGLAAYGVNQWAANRTPNYLVPGSGYYGATASTSTGANWRNAYGFGG